MGKKTVRIGIVAPSSPFERETAARIESCANRLFPHDPPELVFHPQCFERHNHFAGSDAERLAAFLDIANNPSFDTLWFARGGYGACRIAADAIERLEPAARAKTYLGYSDAGVLLAALYGADCPVAHGPMCQDIVREDGEQAIERALRWLVGRDRAGLEPHLDKNQPAAAFNIATFSQILGTPLQPDLTNHIIMFEEISEYMYRIDRMMHQITANPDIRSCAGIRLGRCSDVIENTVEFGMTAEQVVRHWCDKSGIVWLGDADIGHDSANKIVPFG